MKRALVLAAFLLAACDDARKNEARQLTDGGNADRGEALIRRYGCGTCHEIPGVPGAQGAAGPPLSKMRNRTYLAGRLTNNPRNLMRWITDPRAVDPRTAMPDMNVSQTDARDIAAYLYTLK